MAQLIHVKDVSTATGLEVTAGGKVRVYSVLLFFLKISLIVELLNIYLFSHC